MVASAGVFWLEGSLRHDPGFAHTGPDRVVDCAMLRKKAEPVDGHGRCSSLQGVAFTQRLPSESDEKGMERGGRHVRRADGALDLGRAGGMTRRGWDGEREASGTVMNGESEKLEMMGA
jgi:hypothetical protein